MISNVTSGFARPHPATPMFSMMDTGHRIEKVRHMPRTSIKRRVERRRVSPRMADGHGPPLFYGAQRSQFNTSVNLRSQRRHMNASPSIKEAAKPADRQLPALKILRPQCTTHLFVGKNAFRNAHQRPVHTGLLTCRSISRSICPDHPPIVLIRIRHQRRHPRRHAAARTDIPRPSTGSRHPRY